MRNVIITLFIVSASIWMLSDTLATIILEADAIKKTALSEYTIQIGTQEPCVTTVPLEAWNSLNQMEIYRWVVKCELTKGN